MFVVILIVEYTPFLADLSQIPASSLFLFLTIDISFPFFRTNSSLKSIAWSHVFFISILSNSFSNTFRYLWSLLKTISSTVLISIKSSYYFCFSSIILDISISSFIVGFLNFSFFSFSFFFYFYYPYFVCFIFYCFPYLSRHLIIFTFIFQSIFGLWHASYSISNIILVMGCLNTNNFIFLFFYFSDFILIFFSLFFYFSFGWWRGMWHCSHMMWHHKPRTWWKDLEDNVRAHVYNMIALSRK